MKETPTPMGTGDIQALHDEIFAPWIQALGIQPAAVEDTVCCFTLPESADLRNVVDGDASPSGKGVLRIARGIEVGHIFQLGRNTVKR